MSSVATRTFGAGRCYYVVQSVFRYGGKYGTIFSQGVGRLTMWYELLSNSPQQRTAAPNKKGDCYKVPFFICARIFAQPFSSISSTNSKPSAPS